MKKPNNWTLVEMYEGNYIFEDSNEEFQVSVDKMGRMTPAYRIHFNQLKGHTLKITSLNGAHLNHADEEDTAIKRAYEMMHFINEFQK